VGKLLFLKMSSSKVHFKIFLRTIKFKITIFSFFLILKRGKPIILRIKEILEKVTFFETFDIS